MNVLTWILAVIVTVFLAPLIIVCTVVLLLTFLVVWAVGCPIMVTSDGKQIGYLRWTKFYPTR